MSLVFNRTVRLDMVVTGFVCAVVIDRVINRITGNYRRMLAEANQRLEERVRERTAELERAADAQAALREELMVRDRMATAGMLAAGVSHEIRSPLGVIRIAIDEIADIAGTSLAPELRAMLVDVSDATDRIALILRDLGSLARPIDDPLCPVELAEVVESASRLASYRLGPTARLERDSLDVPAVVGNAPRLVQLVLNLVVNAARASRPDAPNIIRVTAQCRDESVVLAIRHVRRDAHAPVRAVLHHRRGPRWDRPGPHDLPLARRADGRLDRDRHRARTRHDGRGHAAAGRGHEGRGVGVLFSERCAR
jgi:C4-dicarboxylate-specific signal transduction histidine kinase